MTTGNPPSTKSTPAPSGQLSPADPARTPAGSGAPKDAARRAPFSALRSDPHPAPHRPPEQAFFGLHIIAPPQWSAVTSATATCRCGYHQHAKGRARVLRLTEDWDHHRTETCPLRTAQEGTEAA